MHGSTVKIDTQTFLLHLLQSSTCFEQYLAHPQEVKLFYYSIWYRHSQLVTVQCTG